MARDDVRRELACFPQHRIDQVGIEIAVQPLRQRVAHAGGVLQCKRDVFDRRLIGHRNSRREEGTTHSLYTQMVGTAGAVRRCGLINPAGAIH